MTRQLPKPRSRQALLALRLVPLLLILWAVFPGREAAVRVQGQEPGRTWLSVAPDARTLGSLLMRDYPEALDAAARRAIQAALDDFGQAGRAQWQVVSKRTALSPQQIREDLQQADRRTVVAAEQMIEALASTPDLMVLPDSGAAELKREIVLPFHSGVLLIRRQQLPGIPPEFLRRTVDLRLSNPILIELPAATNFFLALELENPETGASQVHLELTSGSERLARLALAVEAPPRVPARIRVVDTDGNPAEAAVGLYSLHGRLLVPDGALDFSGAGYNYAATRYRGHHNTKFWPAQDERFARCFFTKGEFQVPVPPGSYRLIASKGPEFVPVDRVVSLMAGQNAIETVKLERWTDMSKKGWHSGDGHLHFERLDDAANQRLALWVQAEDVKVANVLRMGDARKTYFEQYAFGEAGRFAHAGGVFVPGQEDPRTSFSGHTISLNLQKAIRFPETYYLYSKVYDEAHRQGGLSGYAHVNSGEYFVDRDMTLNIARGKVDFAEICEFGNINTDIYYQFLNLGFRVTATAGSDVPWGGTAGDARFYVYTGKPQVDAGEWFRALGRGRTFVTLAPMLEFEVDGRPPGDELLAEKGQKLRVRARATVASAAVPLGALEIVANGEVVRSAEPDGNKASVDFEIPASGSMWIAARTRDSHTTPVYVTVGGQRHWRTSEVPQLLAKRQEQLDEIERVLGEGEASIGPGRDAIWENPAAFRNSAEQLRQMVAEARQVYIRLEQEFEQTPPGH